MTQQSLSKDSLIIVVVESLLLYNIERKTRDREKIGKYINFN